MYRNTCSVLPQTRLTCEPTTSLRLASYAHQPCSTSVCHTPVPCCTTARPQSPYMFQAHSAVSQGSQTTTLITRWGMLFLLCWQHCNKQRIHKPIMRQITQFNRKQLQIYKISTPQWWKTKCLSNIRTLKFKTLAWRDTTGPELQPFQFSFLVIKMVIFRNTRTVYLIYIMFQELVLLLSSCNWLSWYCHFFISNNGCDDTHYLLNAKLLH